MSETFSNPTDDEAMPIDGPRPSAVRSENGAKQQRSPRNQTLQLSAEDRARLAPFILTASDPRAHPLPPDSIIQGDFFECAELIAPDSIDLLFVDPPYNLTKQFNRNVFRQRSLDEYADWLESWLPRIYPALKREASVYICGDWRSSSAIHQVCEKYFTVRNRITFEREKGRGARNDWKNSSEDIWFCTVSKNYYFNSEAVKLKRRVIAPYRLNGKARDWDDEDDGKFRLTNSSNLWTDITVPFWSMSENTPHPTQKPEKLLAKILLASSQPGDRVLDPFAGSGTTGVVARKLGREFQMIELEEEYCLYALRRLELADANANIQGYADSVFWERNSAPNLRPRPQASRLDP
ncbi:MAG: DNA methyltransferase [bacterium]|nr:DNA methyltransferase [bacterium]